MKNRQAGFVFAPTPTDEAPGVTIRRAIGGERMAILDPFLLLDHPTVAASSAVVGFPRHPHRGIETLSYVLLGEVGHKDSLGNEGTVGAGGAQWMTAGNGIFHEEMLIPGPEGAEFLQLWFSLPRDEKRIPPAYVGAQANEVPEVVLDGATVRVVAGSFHGTPGPFQGIAVRPTVLDISLSVGQSLEIPVAEGEAAILYITRGEITVEGKSATAPNLMVLTDGDLLSLSAPNEAARALFVSAKPLNEPILQYRSLVMNTVEDIQESVAMIEAGSFAVD
jgi:quercetin 2,3-dioxygenase